MTEVNEIKKIPLPMCTHCNERPVNSTARSSDKRSWKILLVIACILRSRRFRYPCLILEYFLEDKILLSFSPSFYYRYVFIL